MACDKQTYTWITGRWVLRDACCNTGECDCDPPSGSGIGGDNITTSCDTDCDNCADQPCTWRWLECQDFTEPPSEFRYCCWDDQPVYPWDPYDFSCYVCGGVDDSDGNHLDGCDNSEDTYSCPEGTTNACCNDPLCGASDGCSHCGNPVDIDGDGAIECGAIGFVLPQPANTYICGGTFQFCATITLANGNTYESCSEWLSVGVKGKELCDALNGLFDGVVLPGIGIDGLDLNGIPDCVFGPCKQMYHGRWNWCHGVASQVFFFGLRAAGATLTWTINDTLVEHCECVEGLCNDTTIDRLAPQPVALCDTWQLTQACCNENCSCIAPVIPDPLPDADAISITPCIPPVDTCDAQMCTWEWVGCPLPPPPPGGCVPGNQQYREHCQPCGDPPPVDSSGGDDGDRWFTPAPLVAHVSVLPPASPALLVDLVAYWNLNETPNADDLGTRLDSHGGFDLTMPEGHVAGTSGKINNAAKFGGYFDRDCQIGCKYLQHVDDDDLSMSGDFTITAWVKRTTIGDRTIIFKGDPTGTWLTKNIEYELWYHHADAQFEFTVGSGSTSGTVHSTITNGVSLHTWYFIVASYDATDDKLKISVDGGTVDEAAYAAGSHNTTGKLYLGRKEPMTSGSYARQRPWIGDIDEVSLWKRLLTADEIEDLYDDGDGFPYPFIPVEDCPTCTRTNCLVLFFGFAVNSCGGHTCLCYENECVKIEFGDSGDEVCKKINSLSTVPSGGVGPARATGSASWEVCVNFDFCRSSCVGNDCSAGTVDPECGFQAGHLDSPCDTNVIPCGAAAPAAPAYVRDPDDCDYWRLTRNCYGDCGCPEPVNDGELNGEFAFIPCGGGVVPPPGERCCQGNCIWTYDGSAWALTSSTCAPIANGADDCRTTGGCCCPQEPTTDSTQQDGDVKHTDCYNSYDLNNCEANVSSVNPAALSTQTSIPAPIVTGDLSSVSCGTCMWQWLDPVWVIVGDGTASECYGGGDCECDPASMPSTPGSMSDPIEPGYCSPA
jgi:hypothetical protein